MAVLIYSEQAGDKLKLLAEVGEDNVELAIDALLDAEPKFANQQPFVVFPVDSRMIVEAGDVVRPRRDIKISGGDSNGRAQEEKKPRATRTRKPKAQVEQGEVETEPEPATEAPAKPARKRSSSKPAAKRSGKKGSPFTRNPKSDE